MKIPQADEWQERQLNPAPVRRLHRVPNGRHVLLPQDQQLLANVRPFDLVFPPRAIAEVKPAKILVTPRMEPVGKLIDRNLVQRRALIVDVGAIEAEDLANPI